MPLTQISMLKGKPSSYRRCLMDQVYLAMREVFDVPENDRFMTVVELDRENLDYGQNYLGIRRTDELIIVQVTANNTRTSEQKKAFYKNVAGRLSEELGIDPQDVFINLVEVPKENWSFGNGEAQYA